MRRREVVRWHRASADSVRQAAGVSEQSDECPNGERGCPGPSAETDALPCFGSLLDSGDDGSSSGVATDGGHTEAVDR